MPRIAQVQSNPKKRADFTYGIRKEDLALHLPDNTAIFYDSYAAKATLRRLDDYVVGARRSLIDRYEMLRQAIGYTLFYKIINIDTIPEIRFAVYKRNKMNGETKLANALSLGAGGHTERPDLAYYLEEGSMAKTAEIDLTTTMYNNIDREFGEEVQLINPEHPRDFSIRYPELLGFVMDSKEPGSGYVGNSHFGVIAGIRVPESYSFEMKEPMNDAVGWFSPGVLMRHVSGALRIEDGPDFEPWSEMIIKEMSYLSLRLLEQAKEEHRTSQQLDTAPGDSPAVSLEKLIASVKERNDGVLKRTCQRHMLEIIHACGPGELSPEDIDLITNDFDAYLKKIDVEDPSA